MNFGNDKCRKGQILERTNIVKNYFELGQILEKKNFDIEQFYVFKTNFSEDKF